MKTKLILIFAATFALTTASTQAEFCGFINPNPPVWFDCWDCPWQCHGDADCQAEGFMKYRVYANDLNIVWIVMMGAKEGNWPARYPDDLNYDPCADFDRDLDVDTCDQMIQEQWFGEHNVPPDCPTRPLKLEPIDPNTLPSGSTYTIKWTDVPVWACHPMSMAENSDSCERSYYLRYSIDNGENWLPVDDNSVSDTCSYDWVVPEADSNQCLLRIEDAYVPLFEYYGPVHISDTIDEPFIIYQCQKNLPGDRDGNCYVNFGDFAILASTWLIETDANDLSTLAQDWCNCGNPYDPICAD